MAKPGPRGNHVHAWAALDGAGWQPRFWEHTIRDARDYVRHFDYIHWNPVKHGLVRRVKDWPWSTFHRYLRMGEYDETWCGHVTLPHEGEYILAE